MLSDTTLTRISSSRISGSSKVSRRRIIRSMQTYSSCFHNKTLLHHILKHDRFQQSQLGKAYFRKQRLDNRALGGLCAAAHDIRGSGCSRETDSVLLAHILRLGICQRGHHAVTRTDRTADRNLESLSVNRAALAQIQRTA